MDKGIRIIITHRGQQFKSAPVVLEDYNGLPFAEILEIVNETIQSIASGAEMIKEYHITLDNGTTHYFPKGVLNNSVISVVVY